MPQRQLEAPKDLDRNLLLYDDGGRILGGLKIRDHERYITAAMLYRYCSMVFIFVPPQTQWAIFRLQPDGTTSDQLRDGEYSLVDAGNYVIMGLDGNPIKVDLSPDTPPRRVITRTPSSNVSRDSNHLQDHFRQGLRERDQRCAITNKRFKYYEGLDAAHIYPVARVNEWDDMGYRHWITDTSGPEVIGETGLYSLQNGLLRSRTMHVLWDIFVVGVDPDADFKISTSVKKMNTETFASEKQL
ncbi:hypothetical protein F5884DRAFT_850753 [Xylogone sp. PMI_703]|nr:hypothetical protein F5884DRAFT_850753 [Xylogone sp. PMI_703]